MQKESIKSYRFVRSVFGFILMVALVLTSLFGLSVMAQSADNTPCANTNLALGAEMSASSAQNARTANRANNGIIGGAATNSWSAADFGEEWLMVDFGRQINFNTVRIYQIGNRIADYRFEYSNDGVSWTSFHSGRRIMGEIPGYYEFTNPWTIEAQFVRLFSERSIGVTPIMVSEFEIFYIVCEPEVSTPCADTNLALGALMRASSDQNSRTADRANNGIRGGAALNSWSAAGIGQEWLLVDFGRQVNFNTVRIYQAGNRIADYRFEYSNDGVSWTTFHSGRRIMVETPGYYNFTNPWTIEARFVRLLSERSAGVLPIAVFEFEIYYVICESEMNTPCAETNLALGALMSASSTQNARTADRANNGIRGGTALDSWSAAGIGQEWLMVDFGRQLNFNTVRIYQIGNRIMDYQFEYSNDGVNWTTFHSGSRIMVDSPGHYEFIHPSTIEARFVRLLSERSIGVLPIMVFEFEIYYMP